LNKEGYKVRFRISDLKKGKEPKPFHTSNPSTMENIQLFCDKNELGLTIPQDQLFNGVQEGILAIDSFGYKYQILFDTFKRRKTLPQVFNPANPYVLDNVEIFCKNFAPDYLFKPGQDFTGVKEKYDFLFNNPVTNVIENYQSTWDNFFRRFDPIAKEKRRKK
jgi:hypothetical protein